MFGANLAVQLQQPIDAMWKTRNWLDRNYGSIAPVVGERVVRCDSRTDEENQRPLTSLSAAEEADKSKARFVLVLIFSAVCFALTGTFVLALVMTELSKVAKESWASTTDGMNCTMWVYLDQLWSRNSGLSHRLVLTLIWPIFRYSVVPLRRANYQHLGLFVRRGICMDDRTTECGSIMSMFSSRPEAEKTSLTIRLWIKYSTWLRMSRPARRNYKNLDVPWRSWGRAWTLAVILKPERPDDCPFIWIQLARLIGSDRILKWVALNKSIWGIFIADQGFFELDFQWKSKTMSLRVFSFLFPFWAARNAEVSRHLALSLFLLWKCASKQINCLVLFDSAIISIVVVW